MIATITWMNGAGDMEQKGRKERHPHDGLRVLARLIVRKLAREGTNEDRPQFQRMIAVGGPGRHIKSPRGAFPHAPEDLLTQVGRIEFVQALDDGLHELPGGGVIEGFGE